MSTTGTTEISIKVKYFNLAREKSGVPREEIKLPASGTAADLLEDLKSRHSDEYRRYFFNKDGGLKHYIRMVRIKDSRQVETDYRLSDGEEIYLFVATSGG